MQLIHRRHVLRQAVGATGLALLSAACGRVTPATPTVIARPARLRAAFVYIGKIGDFGWTWAHDQGRRRLEDMVPNVTTVFRENIVEEPLHVSEGVIRDLAKDGAQVIFTTSFGYMEPTLTVAKEFPNSVFIHISGFKTASNVGTGFGKIEEPRYVSGLVAGKMTTSNTIGYVAAFPIPEVLRGINAFALGVRKSNPAARVKVTWTNTWFNEITETKAAVGLLDGGADIIAQHQDTLGPQLAAEERGKFSIGYNSDMRPFAPKAVLTTPVWNWEVFYSKTLKEVSAGTWKSNQYWGGWQDGVVDLAPFGSMVPEPVRKMAEAEIVKFKNGDQTIYSIFVGPLKDQNGVERVAAGKSMTAEELLGIKWLLDNVTGPLPTA